MLTSNWSFPATNYWDPQATNPWDPPGNLPVGHAANGNLSDLFEQLLKLFASYANFQQVKVIEHFSVKVIQLK